MVRSNVAHILRKVFILAALEFCAYYLVVWIVVFLSFCLLFLLFSHELLMSIWCVSSMDGLQYVVISSLMRVIRDGVMKHELANLFNYTHLKLYICADESGLSCVVMVPG